MAISDLMDGMLDDVLDTLGQTVTVRVRTAGALTTATGARAFTTTDYSVTAVPGPVMQSRGERGQDCEMQDFRIRVADLGGGSVTPEPQDLVVDAQGRERNIVHRERVAGGRAWKLVTRTTRKL